MKKNEGLTAQKEAVPRGPKTGKRTFTNALADLTIGKEGDASDEPKKTIAQALVAMTQRRIPGAPEGIGPILT